MFESKNIRLFPRKLPERKWVEFHAEGFNSAVSGVIYGSNAPTCCGVPLGGIATGCLDVDVRGVFGFNALFNIPYQEFAFSGKRGNIFKADLMRKLPDYTPFLGLSISGLTWVLASRNILDGGMMETCVDPVFIDRKENIIIPKVEAVKAAKSISYWGHYPIVDMEYELEKPVPVSVGLRSWAPFIPGDLDVSSTPCSFFEVHLHNLTDKKQKGTLAFSFPGPLPSNAENDFLFSRKVISEECFTGVEVNNGLQSYLIAVLGESDVYTGGELGRNGAAWDCIDTTIPAVDGNEPGASIAINFALQPKDETKVVFLLSWYAPEWHGNGDHYYTAMYASRYVSALDIAKTVAGRYSELLQKVIAWQQEIYSEKQFPIWLRDCLVNSLALIPETSYWAQTKHPLGDGCYSGGLFGMLESPRGCPQIECIPCTWYGNMPIVYFFPELAWSTLAGYKNLMREDGEVPFMIGSWGRPDMATPEYGWQISLNGPCFVMLVDRLWRSTGDKKVLEEFYSSVKKNTTLTMNLRSTPAGVISMPSDNRGMEWFEWGEWAGMCAHIGALRLATLKIVKRMAEEMNDLEYAKQCNKWHSDGSIAMEEKLWAGNYYINFYEEETGKRSEAVMAYQLDGEWAARFHGFPGVVSQDRVKTVLDTIYKCNISASNFGAINFTTSDGKPLATDDKVVEYGGYSQFLPEVMILGMTYIYAGEREIGLELIWKVMEQMICIHGHTWDLPNAIYGDTGARQFGTDYYQNMIIWAVPAALENEDIQGICQKGGLVDRVLRAGQSFP